MTGNEPRRRNLYRTTSCHSASESLAGVERKTVCLETSDREGRVLRQRGRGGELFEEAVSVSTKPVVVQSRRSRERGPEIQNKRRYIQQIMRDQTLSQPEKNAKLHRLMDGRNQTKTTKNPQNLQNVTTIHPMIH